MAGQNVNVQSIELLRFLITAMRQFEVEARSALDTLEVEGRKPADWVEYDRTAYWAREGRKASNDLSEARVALQRAELTTSSDMNRFAHDERKALEKAKRRLRVAEEKNQEIKRWRSLVAKEVEEFLGRVTKLREYMIGDFPRGMAALDRMAGALEKYSQVSAGQSTSTENRSATETGDSAS